MLCDISDKSDRALFIGDIIRHPILPDWNSVFCEDPDQARDTRRKMLDLAVDKTARLVPVHFGGTHSKFVKREEKSFRPVFG